ncbi:MAG: SgcJ/EcaC family oxidoreductase [Casimicrobiaceae bacterium]
MGSPDDRSTGSNDDRSTGSNKEVTLTRLAEALALGLLATVAFYGSPAYADAVRDGVEAGNRAFIAAFLRGDAQAVANLYTENAQVIAPGAPVARGRTAIAAAWQKAINTGVKDIVLSTADVESAGDLACETGVVRLVARDGGVTEGRYVVVWKRAHGQWKLHRDIWNVE